MPPIKRLPDSYFSERGTEEFIALQSRVESGELSKAVIVDDEVSGRDSVREVFCPIDFDTSYVSEAVFSQLGTIALRWITPHFSPEGCRIASLDQYVNNYNELHGDQKAE